MKKPRTTSPSRPRTKAEIKPETAPEPPERIAKVIARAGLCSRREAEAWITEGRVALNGSVLATPAVTVGPTDVVTVDGQPLPHRDRTRLWLFHKPRGLVTTTHDPEGRRTVFDVLPPDLPRVMTVGRLDINTEGLLLLTNDGGLARVMELPSTGWLRRYRVRAHGAIDQAQLDALRDGVAIDGVLYGAIEATVDRKQGANAWLTMGLREGKNREIKNILMHLGLDVTRLIRLSFGPFQLGALPEGAVEEVPRRHLKDQLGDTLAAAAGADFDVREDDRKPHMPPRGAGVSEAPDDRAENRDRGGGRGKQALAKQRPAKPPGRQRPAKPPGRHAASRGGERVPAASARSEVAERPASKAREHRPDAARSRRRHEADVDHNAGVERRRPTLALKTQPERAPRPSPVQDDSPRGQKSRREIAAGRRGGVARAEAIVERKPRKERDAEGETPRLRGERHAGGHRSAGSSGDRPSGGKPGGHRSAGSAGDRPSGGKPGGRRSAGSAGDRPSGGKPGGHRSAGSAGDRPSGGKPGGHRSAGSAGHSGHRSAGSAGDRPSGGKPGGHRSTGSAGDKPSGGYRSAGSAGDRPSGGKPGDRSPRPGGRGPGGDSPSGQGPGGRGPRGGPGGRGADRRR